MREIKFRAWDKKALAWVRPEGKSICFPYAISPSKPWDERLALFGISNKDYEDIVWMQYTGFIDKDSKEIYEGDILRVLFGKQHIERIFLVEWGVNGYHPRTLGRFRNTITVIGNKYENPELLK